MMRSDHSTAQQTSEFTALAVIPLLASLAGVGKAATPGKGERPIPTLDEFQISTIKQDSNSWTLRSPLKVGRTQIWRAPCHQDLKRVIGDGFIVDQIMRERVT